LPRLKRLHGGGRLERIEAALGWGWWRGDAVNARRLSRLLESEKLACDAAYVSVATEGEARRAASIVRRLGQPYVVHLMDLCHEQGIVPAAMPGYRTLLGQAHGVFVVSEPLRDEVRRVRADGVEVVAVAKRLGSLASPPAADSGVLRMVMLGSLGSADNPALSVLADALPVLRARWPTFECLYMGQHYHMLPDRLRPLVTYPGRISLETFEQLLSTAHVAFLPSPQRLDCYGRFSPVARLTDYFAAGLPVLYCVAKGSVAEQLLTPLSPLAAARADTPESLVAAVERFAEPVQWREASRLLRSHAEEHFAIGRLREKVLGALGTTCGAATLRERKDCHVVG
jgi:hypothetical protein